MSKLFLNFAVASVLLAGQSGFNFNALAAGDWNVTKKTPLEKFVIQSHRGAGELAPENTLEAFQLGWKLGTVPECDVRTTKDGVIVTFHDATFERVVKGASPELQKKGPADITWDELSKLDVGAWKGGDFVGRRVIKVEDVFSLMRGHPDRRLYLDIKNVDLKQLAAQVKTANVEGQVILASPKHSIIQEWKSLVPSSDTLLWVSTTKSDYPKRIDAVRKENFRGITQLQLHIYLQTDKTKNEPFTVPNAFISKLGDELRDRKILFQTLPWGTTDEKVYDQLLDLGVESFATDYPDVTLRAVRKYYERRAPKKFSEDK